MSKIEFCYSGSDLFPTKNVLKCFNLKLISFNHDQESFNDFSF